MKAKSAQAMFLYVKNGLSILFSQKLLLFIIKQVSLMEAEAENRYYTMFQGQRKLYCGYSSELFSSRVY